MIDAIYYPESADAGSNMYYVMDAVTRFSSSTTMISLAALGMLLGILAMALKSMQTRQLDLIPFFLSILVFFTMFDSKGNVIITHDNSDLPKYVVNDVPLGIVLPMKLISEITHHLHQEVLVNYSLPSGGFSENTETMSDPGRVVANLGKLLKYRENLLNMQSLVASPGGTIDPSVMTTINYQVYHYVKTCISESDQAKLNEIKRSSTPLELLKSTWHTKLVELNLEGQAQTYTCADAGDIVASLASKPELMNAFWNNKSVATDSKTQSEVVAESHAFVNHITDGYVDSLKFMRNAYIFEIVSLVEEAGMTDSNNAVVAKMLADAREARIYNSMAGESLWQETVWKSKAYIEFLVYAMFPLMVFSLMLGASGLKLLGSYVVLLIWLGLWSTGTVLVQFFTEVGISNAREALSDPTGTSLTVAEFLNTPMGVMQYYNEISRWYSTGSEMMVAVPMLMIALVTGSMFHIANIAKQAAATNGEIDSTGLTPASGNKEYGNTKASIGQNSNGIDTTFKGVGSTTDDMNNVTTSVSNQDVTAAEKQVSDAKSVVDEKSKVITAKEQDSFNDTKSVTQNKNLSTGLSSESLETAGKTFTSAYNFAKSQGMDEQVSRSYGLLAKAGLSTGNGMGLFSEIGSLEDEEEELEKKRKSRKITDKEYKKQKDGLKSKRGKLSGKLSKFTGTKSGNSFLTRAFKSGTKGALSAIGIGANTSLSRNHLVSAAARVNQQMSENSQFAEGMTSALKDTSTYTDTDQSGNVIGDSKLLALENAYSEKDSATQKYEAAKSRKETLSNAKSKNIQVGTGEMIAAIAGNKQLRAIAAQHMGLYGQDKKSFLQLGNNGYKKQITNWVQGENDVSKIFSLGNKLGISGLGAFSNENEQDNVLNPQAVNGAIENNTANLTESGEDLTGKVVQGMKNGDNKVAAGRLNGKTAKEAVGDHNKKTKENVGNSNPGGYTDTPKTKEELQAESEGNADAMFGDNKFRNFSNAIPEEAMAAIAGFGGAGALLDGLRQGSDNDKKTKNKQNKMEQQKIDQEINSAYDKYKSKDGATTDANANTKPTVGSASNGGSPPKGDLITKPGSTTSYPNGKMTVKSGEKTQSKPNRRELKAVQEAVAALGDSGKGIGARLAARTAAGGWIPGGGWGANVAMTAADIATTVHGVLSQNPEYENMSPSEKLSFAGSVLTEFGSQAGGQISESINNAGNTAMTFLSTMFNNDDKKDEIKADLEKLASQTQTEAKQQEEGEVDKSSQTQQQFVAEQNYNDDNQRLKDIDDQRAEEDYYKGSKK